MFLVILDQPPSLKLTGRIALGLLVTVRVYSFTSALASEDEVLAARLLE